VISSPTIWPKKKKDINKRLCHSFISIISNKNTMHHKSKKTWKPQFSSISWWPRWIQTSKVLTIFLTLGCPVWLDKSKRVFWFDWIDKEDAWCGDPAHHYSIISVPIPLSFSRLYIFLATLSVPVPFCFCHQIFVLFCFPFLHCPFNSIPKNCRPTQTSPPPTTLLCCQCGINVSLQLCNFLFPHYPSLDAILFGHFTLLIYISDSTSRLLASNSFSFFFSLSRLFEAKRGNKKRFALSDTIFVPALECMSSSLKPHMRHHIWESTLIFLSLWSSTGDINSSNYFLLCSSESSLSFHERIS